MMARAAAVRMAQNMIRLWLLHIPTSKDDATNREMLLLRRYHYSYL
jgi:hypothetical protein